MTAIPEVDMAQMQVQVPEGVAAGQMIQVQSPAGQMLQVQVPAGVAPGQMFMIQVPGAVAADNEDDYEAYSPLNDMKFNVSDPCEQCAVFLSFPCAGITTKTLDLTDQEVTFRTKNLCFSNRQKRPYAQLGSVDKHTLKCGCHTLVSDFSPLNEQGEGGLKIGCCGTDSQAVERIVQELQMRKAKRGGIAQIRKLDYVISKMVKIGTQVPVLLNTMGVDFAKKPQPAYNKVTLHRKEIDVSNYIEKFCSCTTKTLVLEPEEAHFTISACFGLHTINTKREYGQLGFVEKKKDCICCFRLASDISPIPGQSDMQPGCPCTNRAKVSMLVRELRDRMSVRGQVGQIKKQEVIMDMVGDVEDNLKLLMTNQGVQYPPTQDEMKSRFGENSPVIGAPREQPETVECRTYDVTGNIDACLTCLCTCGIAGCTKESLELSKNNLYIKTKNNLDDSDVKIPYAELDSVDMIKSCCCCYTVNDMTPGWGCDKIKVEQITENLQECKTKRGNIAHLKQLRSMQATAMSVDLMAEKLLQKEGIEYPPTPQVMDQVFPDKKPRALTHQQNPQIEPHQDFDAKSYSVTNYIECCVGCLFCPCKGPATSTLELLPDEMLLVKEDWCNRSTSRTSYGNLGAVETEVACCCCSQLPDIATPGCGCSGSLVDEIAADLQERKVKRGNIAQMKQQENIIIEILNTEAKVDMLMHKRGLKYPPTPEVMATVFVQNWAASKDDDGKAKE